MLCDAPARKPRTHASHTAPPLPGRDHSRSPSTRVHVCLPRAPLTVVAHDSGPDRRVTALYETMFGSTSTCSSRAFQRYHSQVRQPPPWLSTFESGVQNQVRPPLLPCRPPSPVVRHLDWDAATRAGHHSSCCELYTNTLVVVVPRQPRCRAVSRFRCVTWLFHLVHSCHAPQLL